MSFPMVNYPTVPHTWVLLYRVNQRSHVTKITEIKRNLTQFICRKFNHNFIIIVIGCCILGLKTPFQLTTLNVMGASWSFWRIHGYLTRKSYLGKCRSHHLIQFPVVKGQFTTLKVSRVTAPIGWPFFLLRHHGDEWTPLFKKNWCLDRPHPILAEGTGYHATKGDQSTRHHPSIAVILIFNNFWYSLRWRCIVVDICRSAKRIFWVTI